MFFSFGKYISLFFSVCFCSLFKSTCKNLTLKKMKIFHNFLITILRNKCVIFFVFHFPHLFMKIFFWSIDQGHAIEEPSQRLHCFEWVLKGLAPEVNLPTTTIYDVYAPPITFTFDGIGSPADIPMRLEVMKLLLTYGTTFFYISFPANRMHFSIQII